MKKKKWNKKSIFSLPFSLSLKPINIKREKEKNEMVRKISCKGK